MQPVSMQRVRPVRFQTTLIIGALVLREAAGRFGRRVGGYFWAFAEPIGGILLLSIAFSYLLRSPPVGDSFLLFYASGVVPLLFFSALSSSLSQGVAANKGLLAYPIVSVLDVIVARSLLEFITYVTVFGVIVAVIVTVDKVNLHLDVLVIFLGLSFAYLFGVAIGMANCILFLFIPVWRSIWRIITRPLLIISGVIFTYHDMPPEVRDWLWYNPLLQIVGLVRAGLYESYDASYVSVPYIFTVSLVLIAISALYISLNESRVIQQ